MSEQNEGSTDIVEQVAISIGVLLGSNSDRIHKIIDDSQSHKLSIGIRVLIDSSGSAPEAKVTIRYTPERVADSLVIHGEDPNQLGLCIHNPDAENRMGDQSAPVKRKPGRPKGSGKKKQPVDKPVEPTVEPTVEPAPVTKPEAE